MNRIAKIVALAGLVVLTAAPMPWQDYMVHGRRPAAAPGGCAGSPDLSSVTYSIAGWAATTSCSSVQTTYTSDNDAEDAYDYVDGTTWTLDQTPSVGTCGIHTAPTPTNGDFVGNAGCVFEVDIASSSTDCELWSNDTDETPVWNDLGTSGQMMIEFFAKEADTPLGGAPQFLQHGTNNMSISFRDGGNNDIDVQFQPNVGLAAKVGTGTNASEYPTTCCNGTDCNGVIENHDDAVLYITFTFEVATASADYRRLYVNYGDGSGGSTRCLVDDDSGLSLDDGDGWANAERLFIGSIANNDWGTWYIGGIWMSTDPTLDLFNAISGGDGDMTNGNECLCTDVGGGTDCAG